MKDRFSDILAEKDSGMIIPEDFESNMNAIIKKQALEKASNLKSVRLMYLFFALGLIFGIILSTKLENLEFSLLDQSFIIDKMVLLFPIIAIILIIFGKIYNATLIKNGKYS